MIDNSTNDNNYKPLSVYELCKESGTLDFWDDPNEDIYTFEDGEPVE